MRKGVRVQRARHFSVTVNRKDDPGHDRSRLTQLVGDDQRNIRCELGNDRLWRDEERLLALGWRQGNGCGLDCERCQTGGFGDLCVGQRFEDFTAT